MIETISNVTFDEGNTYWLRNLLIFIFRKTYGHFHGTNSDRRIPESEILNGYWGPFFLPYESLQFLDAQSQAGFSKFGREGRVTRPGEKQKQLHSNKEGRQGFGEANFEICGWNLEIFV